jgi:hypothetical protein
MSQKRYAGGGLVNKQLECQSSVTLYGDNCFVVMESGDSAWQFTPPEIDWPPRTMTGSIGQ